MERPKRQRVSSGAPWETTVGYSRAIRVGDTVHVSGTVGIDADGVPADGPYAQTRRALDIVAGALGEAGATLGDVVRTRLYVTDIDDWEAVGRAHREAFGDVRPASTMVEVSRLVEPGLCVEVEVTAVVDGDGD